MRLFLVGFIQCDDQETYLLMGSLAWKMGHFVTHVDKRRIADKSLLSLRQLQIKVQKLGVMSEFFSAVVS